MSADAGSAAPRKLRSEMMKKLDMRSPDATAVVTQAGTGYRDGSTVPEHFDVGDVIKGALALNWIACGWAKAADTTDDDKDEVASTDTTDDGEVKKGRKNG